jgi:hypothetical protein
VFRTSYADFYRAPTGYFIEPPLDATAEKETEGRQEEGLRKRNMGFVYTVIWCSNGNNIETKQNDALIIWVF